jgi:transcriptional regulator with XRE-family HTH domain
VVQRMSAPHKGTTRATGSSVLALAGSLGARVRAARVEAGLKQSELAHRIGVDQPTLSRIETVGRDISSSLLVKIAEGTGRELDYFLRPTPRPGVLLSQGDHRSDEPLKSLENFRRFVEDYEELLRLTGD